jgi:hypothetical protein
MNEILVTIYVLGLDEEYDMFLPIGLGMKDCLNLIQSTINELSDENYVIHDDATLYTADDGKVINLNNVVKYSGLKNGCKVLLK